MPIVYVVNRGPHDYSDAQAYGELVYCTDGSLDRYDTAQMYRELSDAMRDSHADDYLLLTSLTSLCVIAASIFVAKHGCLHLLLHSREGYVERSIFLKV